MKKLIALILIIVTCISLTACMSQEDQLNMEITELEAKVSSLRQEQYDLQKENDSLKTEIIDTKVYNGTAKYVITFNIKQTHFTLDLSQHMKDAMNDISIQIPVDKEYYDSVRIGDVINDSFRMGSFIMKGSFGNWKVTVEDKEIM